VRRILVVDDEESIVSAIAEGLPMVSKQPVEIKTALSGEAARKILENDPDIDVLLCDARMPGLAGLDLLAWTKMRGHRARRILITAYSAHIFPERELERAAPVTVLTKPLNLDQLAKIAAGA
jgi:DNA-binding NtrC family response regulator